MLHGVYSKNYNCYCGYYRINLKLLIAILKAIDDPQ